MNGPPTTPPTREELLIYNSQLRHELATAQAENNDLQAMRKLFICRDRERLARIAELENALPDSTELRILAEWLKFRAISPDADAANQFWAWADAIDAARREGKP